MAKYKIRKGSIAWIVTRKPVQLVAIVGLTFGIFYNIGSTDSFAEVEQAITTPTYSYEQYIQDIEKPSQIEDFDLIEVSAETSYRGDIPLTEEVQNHIESCADSYGIPVGIIYGVINRESRFDASATGDHGNSIGLMQIQPRWNKARMNELQLTDLYNPIENITCGCDIIAELMTKYDSMEQVLIAYNYGESGAYKNCFSKGIYSTEYSRDVLAYAERME